MKTRLFYCDYWEDPIINELPALEKLVGAFYWTNSRANLSGLYPIRDESVAIETGVDVEVVKTTKEKLEQSSKIHFFEGWVYLPNAQKLFGYINENHALGVQKEISKVSNYVLEHFRSIGYAIPYPCTISSPKNKKPKTITYKKENHVEEDVKWTEQDTKDSIDNF